MVRKFTYISFSLAILFVLKVNTALAQENIYENLLKEEVEVLNPVYKPVIGVGAGVLNFIGEVHNNIHSTISGKQNSGYKIDVSTFIDNKNRYFTANFYLLLGNFNGNERSYSDPSHNLNFSSDIYTFGINAIYNFGHFFNKKSIITPFIGIGLEDLQFNSKTDLYDSKGRKYNYWTDGTIRDIDQSLAGSETSTILHRDYTYETDIKDLKRFGLSNYSQNSLCIPIDLGLKFNVSSRIYMKLGTSLHYTFTDNIDGVSFEGKGRTGDKWNDMFTYSYVSFHFDLFSSPKTKTIERLFLDMEGDYIMLDDEDNDGITDPLDKCPHTPSGVEVDSVGCPLDADKDGVPDYLDKEIHSRPNAIVDDNGIEISPDHLALALDTAQAIKREDVETYLKTILGAAKYYKKHGSVTIPEKFKALDTNGDGYLSYEELLKTINDYFDFKNNMSNTDIGELVDFFFTQ